MMKVNVKVIIEEDIEVEAPNNLKKSNDAIEQFLVENYSGFDCTNKGETSFDFKSIEIVQKKS